ncbi:unnamed protein product, partial [Mesorhabditis spiculigera]
MILKFLGAVVCLFSIASARQCPDGASDYSAGNQCLIAFDAAATFDSAQKACALGGQLVQPVNRLHNMLAAAQIQQALSAPNAFIGVMKINGTWRYADGSSLTYQNWKSADEQNKPGASCAFLNGKDFYCSYWFLIGLSHGNWTDGTPFDFNSISGDRNASTYSLRLGWSLYMYPGNITTPYASYVCKQPANVDGLTRKKVISTAIKKVASVKAGRGFVERYCPYDSISYPAAHECVMGMKVGATYGTAGRICSLGGRLIQPMSNDENLMAGLQNAAELGGQATYIGVERIDGTWYYADGTELKYQNWKSPAEINNPDHGCVVLNSSDFFWYSADCLSKRAFICTTPDQTRVCLPGWTYFPLTGYCYYTQMAMNWNPPPQLNFTTAEAVCANEGSHLVSIHSDEENQFVADLLSSAMSTYQHDCDARLQTVIGLSHSKWTDGSTFDYNTGLGMADSYGMSDPACHSTSWSGWNATQIYANYVCKKRAHMLTYF